MYLKSNELRKNEKKKFEIDLFKLMSNSMYGKLLSNARKLATETKFINKVSAFKKLVSVREC